MATGRLAGLTSQTVPDARARLTGLSTSTKSTVNGRLSGLSTRVAAQIRGRLVGIRSAVVQSAVVTVPSRVNIEPGVPVTVVAVLTGGTASAWAWACDTPGVQLTSSGGSLTYTPPGTLRGVTLTFTATATVGGVGVPGSAAHSVLPHAGRFTVSPAGALQALFDR